MILSNLEFSLKSAHYGGSNGQGLITLVDHGSLCDEAHVALGHDTVDLIYVNYNWWRLSTS